MKHPRQLILSALLAVAAAGAAAQVATTSPTRAHVQTLASEQFGGREAGSDGERLAADYIAAQLQRIGAQPLPGRRDLFQSFEFTAGSRDGGSSVSLASSPGVTHRATDVRALSFSDDGSAQGDVVFDGSLASNLARLREQLINRSVHEIQRRRDSVRTAS